MRKVHISVFFVVLALIAAIALGAVFGIYTQYGDITTTIFKGAQETNYDKSISDSATIVLKSEKELSQAELTAAKKVIEYRLNQYGYSSFDVYTDSANSKLVVELAWNAKSSSALTALSSYLSSQGLFEVREGNEVDEDGAATGVTASTVILSNADIKTAEVDTSMYSFGYYALNLKLTNAAKKAYAEKTAAMVEATEEGESAHVSYWLDGSRISYRVISAAVTDGKISINQSDSNAYSNVVTQTMYLRSGPLPAKFTSEATLEYFPKTENTGTGVLSLQIAAACALGVLCLLFIAFYKIPGLCAALALIFQSAIALMTYSGFFNDVSGNVLSLANLSGTLLTLFASAFAYALVCNRVARAIDDGSTAEVAVFAAFDKSRSKLLLAYVGTAIAALVVNIICGIDIFYKSVWSAQVLFLRDASKLVLFGIIAGFVAMLLFRLMLKAIVGPKSSNSAYTSLFYKKMFDGKDKRVIKRTLALVACIVLVLSVVAAVVLGVPASTSYNGETAVVKTFTDTEKVKTDDVTGYLSEISPDLQVKYGYASNGTAYSVSVIIPKGVDVTVAQIDAMFTEKYPATTDDEGEEVASPVTSVSSYTTDGLFTPAILIRAAITFVIAALCVFLFALVTVVRVPNGKAASAALVGSLVAAVSCAALMLVVGVTLSAELVCAAFAVLIAAAFVALCVIYDAEAEKASRKRESYDVAVFAAASDSFANNLAVTLIFLLASAAFLVIGIVMELPVLIFFAAAMMVCSVLTFILPNLFGVSALLK